MGLFSHCEHKWESLEPKEVGFFSKQYLFQHKCEKCGKIEDCTLGVNQHSEQFHDSVHEIHNECFLCRTVTYNYDENMIANPCSANIVRDLHYDEIMKEVRVKYYGEKGNISEKWEKVKV